MIVTKSWLNKFIDLSKVDTEQVCKVFNSIGLEVDSIRNSVVPQKVVVGYVLECEQHPNADKLSVCKIDVGTAVRQIVCGAKNIAKGLYVPVATLGAKLPNGMEIKPAKLRDVESDGMVCSSSELGLPKLYDGIMILDESIGKLVIGKELSEYDVFNDTIIEIELTANRGDCLSIYGVARELSTALEKPLKNVEKVEESENSLGIGRVLHTTYAQNIDLSMVYKAIDFRDSKFPLFMDILLSHIDKHDQHEIAKLVDYIIHTTGVIMRAYNSKSFAKKDGIAQINIKKDTNGIDIVTSGDKLISKIGICDEKKDLENGILIVEASYINPNTVSMAVAENKLKTDELYYKTSRGSEPNLEFGINFLLKTLKNYFNVDIYAGINEHIKNTQDKTININIDKVSKIIGQKVSSSKIVSILTNLGFKTNVTAQENYIVATVPGFRHDISNIQDIVEEITRIIGIDNIASKPLETVEKNSINLEYVNYMNKKSIRYKAIGQGFNETVTFVFGDKAKLEQYGYKTLKDELELLNPITNELNTLRTTILLNLLNGASINTKNGYKSIALFEIGSVFDSDRNESTKLAFVHSGFREKVDLTNNAKPQIMDFFAFANKISAIIGNFELVPITNIDNNLIHMHQSANIILDGVCVGFMSKLNIKVAKDFELQDTFIAEIDFDKLPFNKKSAKEFSKFQSSNRDLSILIPKSLAFKDIKDIINTVKPKEVMKFYPIDIYSSEALGENVSLTIRFELQSNEKTLEEADINTAVDTILDALKQKLQIELR